MAQVRERFVPWSVNDKETRQAVLEVEILVELFCFAANVFHRKVRCANLLRDPTSLAVLHVCLRFVQKLGLASIRHAQARTGIGERSSCSSGLSFLFQAGLSCCAGIVDLALTLFVRIRGHPTPRIQNFLAKQRRRTRVAFFFAAALSAAAFDVMSRWASASCSSSSLSSSGRVLVSAMSMVGPSSSESSSSHPPPSLLLSGCRLFGQPLFLVLLLLALLGLLQQAGLLNSLPRLACSS